MKRLNKDFLEKLQQIYSKDELKIIEEWFSIERPTVFRINSLKNDDYNVIETFKNYGYKLEKVEYLENAYKILEVWKLKLVNMKPFTKWYIYVQGITSQIPVELIDLPENKNDFKVLDLTAAPGWKSTQIVSRLDNKWEIVANEMNLIRYDKLKYTVQKQDAKNIEVIKHDANKLKDIFVPGYFDVIIADLPCSAEWRINLDKEKTFKFLEKQGINKRNYKAQQEIIKNSIWLLKTWGQLVYSTCTIDPLENEWIVHYILSNFSELEVQDISDYFNKKWLKNISKKWIKKYKKYIFRNEVERSVRLLPSKNTEWFFVVKFIKK